MGPNTHVQLNNNVLFCLQGRSLKKDLNEFAKFSRAPLARWKKQYKGPLKSLPYIVKILSVVEYEHKNAAHMAEVRSDNSH